MDEGPQSESSFKTFCRKKWWKWTCVALVALTASQLYYVQEMIAALILFSALFALAVGIALMLFLLDRGLETALMWAGLYAMRVVEVARRTWELGAELGKRPLHRSR